MDKGIIVDLKGITSDRVGLGILRTGAVIADVLIIKGVMPHDYFSPMFAINRYRSFISAGAGVIKDIVLDIDGICGTEPFIPFLGIKA